MVMIKIDAKDRKILYELDINSRQSFSKIGKKVGLHRKQCGISGQ
jgi:DNA-binding Lrp family transcriptional regulator